MHFHYASSVIYQAPPLCRQTLKALLGTVVPYDVAVKRAVDGLLSCAFHGIIKGTELLIDTYIDGIGLFSCRLEDVSLLVRTQLWVSILVSLIFMNKYHGDFTTAVNFSIATMTVTASKGIITTERAALNQENTLYRYRMLIPK